MRTVQPVCRDFGFGRGIPVDRYYIEKFLEENRTDIQGHVLEIADPGYTRKFGGDQVTKSDVLHAVEGNPEATIVGDLVTGEGIPESVYDCFILTETLIVIYDLHSVIRNAYRALKPGGVLLVTTAGIAQIARYDYDHWGDFWRLTSLSLRRLIEQEFPSDNVSIESHGNVLAAVSLLHGVVVEDLTAQELDYRDPDYEVTITARAVKPLDEEKQKLDN